MSTMKAQLHIHVPCCQNIMTENQCFPNVSHFSFLTDPRNEIARHHDTPKSKFTPKRHTWQSKLNGLVEQQLTWLKRWWLSHRPELKILPPPPYSLRHLNKEVFFITEDVPFPRCTISQSSPNVKGMLESRIPSNVCAVSAGTGSRLVSHKFSLQSPINF